MYSAFILFLLVSCNKVEDIDIKDLPDEDQRFYAQRGRIKCLSDTKSNFLDFENDSNNELEDFERGRRWTFKYSDADTTTTTYYHLWKSTSTAVYLIQSSPLNQNNKFIKISKAMNSALIQSLRTKLCDNTDDDLEFTNNNPPRLKKTQFIPRNSKTWFKRVSEYQYKSNLPAYLGSLHLNVNERIVDEDGDDVEKPNPKTYKTTVTSTNDVDFAFETYSEYGGQYCVITEASPFTLPYLLECTSSAANGGGPTGWSNPGLDLNDPEGN